ncbi:MAG: hypothetical protein ACLU3F_15745 [Blautia wexlerae]
MPEDDKTHPDPRPHRLHHRGADHPLPASCYRKGVTPPIDVLPSPVPSEGQGHRPGQDA